MKNKIKSLKYAISVIALTFPVLVGAQFGGNVPIKGAENMPKGTIYTIVQNLMKWILGIVGFVAIIGFCIAGILYLTSAGDDEKQKSAKNAMVYCIIGVVVALAGYVIWNAAQGMLRGGSGGSTTF